MTAHPAILNPEPGDNEDVVSALETADIFWTKGDTDEALRWLKRAAETASDAGDDMRALAIARSAADLKSEPVSSVAAVASTAVDAAGPRKSRPPPPSAIARQASPSATAASSNESGVRPHSSVVPQKAPPPLPPSKARESLSPTAPSVTPSAAAAPAPGQSVSSAAAAPSAPSRSISTDRMPAVSAEARPSPVRGTPSEAPARRAPSPSSLPKEPQRAVSPANAYRAVTVFVRPLGRDGDKLEVILAKPGQPVPAGAEPALLVPTRRGGKLLG